MALTTSGRAGGEAGAGAEVSAGEEGCEAAAEQKPVPDVLRPHRASVGERTKRPSESGSLGEPTNQMCAGHRDGAGTTRALLTPGTRSNCERSPPPRLPACLQNRLRLPAAALQL